MEEKATAPVQAASIENKLPSFKSLYKDAWVLLKTTFTSLIKLFFISLAALFGIVAVVGLFVFLGIMLTPVLGDFSWILIIGALALMVFYIVSIIVISAVSQITYIKIFTSSTKLPIIKTMKESVPLVMPFFVAQLLVQLLVMGGVGLLIIPGIIIAILFSFVSFVVVTENLQGRAALRRSYQLVRPHFWKIVLVSLSLQIPVQIINQIFSSVSQDYPAVFLLSVPFSIGAGLFIQALNIVLYKNAKAVTPTDKPVRMRWILIVAIIGWIVLLGLLIAGFFAAIADPELLNNIAPIPEQ